MKTTSTKNWFANWPKGIPRSSAKNSPFSFSANFRLPAPALLFALALLVVPAKSPAQSPAHSPLLSPSCEGEARRWREGKETASQQQFVHCLGQIADSRSAALATLALGVGELESRNWDRALAQLAQAAPQLPELKDYLAWFQAQALDGKADFPSALQALEPLLQASPESPLLARALPMAVRLALDTQQPARAVALLRRYPSHLPQPTSDIFLASALDAAGKAAEAIPLWERVYFQQPAGPFPQGWDAARVEAAWQSHGSPQKDAAQWLLRASRLAPSRPAQAKAELNSRFDSFSPPQQERATYLLAMADFYAKNYSTAIPALQQAKGPSPDEDAERLHALYQSGRRANREEVSQAALEQLAAQHPTSPWRLEAMLSDSYRYLNENDYARYEPIYADCASNFAKDPKGAFCHWRLTWSNYLRRRTSARQMLRQHLEQFPHSEKGSAALYFLSQQAETPAEAKAYLELIPQHFPNTYYQVLAEEKLAQPSFASLVPQPPDWLARVRFPGPVQPSRHSVPNEDFRIARARLLKAASLDTMAEQELRFAARGQRLPYRIATELANLMYSAGAHERGLRAIKGLLPGYLLFPPAALGKEFWKLAFPLPYRNALQRYAETYDLDPFLVAGLIRQESEFNPRVVSRANAYGLTQIVPSTGRDLARRIKLPGFQPAQLFQPETNVRLGTFYLRNLLQSLNGSWVETLAAYNAGRTRVLKWRTFGDFREPAEFVETIPFGETRDYVQSVLRNGAVYRQLYSGEPLTLASDNTGPSDLAASAPAQSPTQPPAQSPVRAATPAKKKAATKATPNSPSRYAAKPKPNAKITQRVSSRSPAKANAKPANRRLH